MSTECLLNEERRLDYLRRRFISRAESKERAPVGEAVCLPS